MAGRIVALPPESAYKPKHQNPAIGGVFYWPEFIDQDNELVITARFMGLVYPAAWKCLLTLVKTGQLRLCRNTDYPGRRPR